MNKGMILIVDDEEINRFVLAQAFEEKYETVTAEDGEIALERILEYQDRLKAVLLDVFMPVMSGFDVLEAMEEEDLLDKVPVIMITGDGSADIEEKALGLGAVEFVTKPFEIPVIQMRVRNTIELFAHKRNLEQLVREQTERIERQKDRLKTSNYRLLEAIATMVEFRDLETGEHIVRIKAFTRMLAEAVMKNYPEYELTQEKIERIVYASATHDIGKISVPDAILLKPAKLTADEFEIMKTHTTVGAELIRNMNYTIDQEYSAYCTEICLYHHEKYDGKGYPKGLVGDDIPISAQIVSIADVFDALVSERCYKKAYLPEEAFRMIYAGECGMFNPKLLDCLEQCREAFFLEAMKNTERS
ncbi:MAG: response regulator [Lachnospiraceae bacterium]|nr:response regulator [Lachnospiraceae bacterium]